jgi:hypothetical protein
MFIQVYMYIYGILYDNCMTHHLSTHPPCLNRFFADENNFVLDVYFLCIFCDDTRTVDAFIRRVQSCRTTVFRLIYVRKYDIDTWYTQSLISICSISRQPTPISTSLCTALHLYFSLIRRIRTFHYSNIAYERLICIDLRNKKLGSCHSLIR